MNNATTIEIKHSKTGEVLYSCEALSISAAVQQAIRAGIDLTGADLRGADLTGGDLRGADLRGAALRGSDLTDCDLRGADLTDCDMTGCDLTCISIRSNIKIDVTKKGAAL